MIQEMNRNGILIDLAHTNDPCALDAIEVSEKPVVDSHSGPRAIDPDAGDRSTPDEVMKALAARGGMLGIAVPIRRPAGDYPYTSVPDDQIEECGRLFRYSIDVMGIDHVGVGTHFNTACMPWLTESLLAAGF